MASQSDQARRLKLLLGQDVVPHSSEATAATSPAPAVPSPASTSVSRPGPAEVRWYSDSEESEEASSSSSKKGSSYNHPEMKKGMLDDISEWDSSPFAINRSYSRRTRGQCRYTCFNDCRPCHGHSRHQWTAVLSPDGNMPLSGHASEHDMLTIISKFCDIPGTGLARRTERR